MKSQIEFLRIMKLHFSFFWDNRMHDLPAAGGSCSLRKIRAHKVCCAFLFCLICTTFAAPASLTAQELDAVSQQASQLEAQLGKYNDTTPEAADLMLQLIDLYHDNARVFGLVRISNRFVAAHPRDKRHKGAMLKMIDGLQAMSRNPDLIAACRQFISRYPKDKACGDVEVRLARTLAQSEEKTAAAEAFHAIWRRRKDEAGQQAAIRAIVRYTSADNKSILKGAELAEELLERCQGELAVQIGMKAVESYSRIGKWAESNRAATKLINSGALQDKKALRQLYLDTAENYNRQGQHANSVKSFAAARKLRDDQETHFKMIQQLDRGKASSSEIVSAVKEYAATYSDREDRYQGLSALVQAYLREDKSDTALNLLRQVLPFDARSNDNARVFVERMGTEPEQLADAEKTLREAIVQNEAHASYLRYVLAFNLYRDRMKDNDKMTQTLKELVQRSPQDDQYTRSAISHLLSGAEEGKQFDDTVDLLLKARSENLHVAGFHQAFDSWRQNARRDNKKKARTKVLQEKLEQANSDSILALAAKQNFGNSKQEGQVRDKLLAENNFRKLSDEFANRLLATQAYFYRHYAGNNQRKQSASLYGRLALRTPEDFEIAKRWLESATDYSEPEVAKEAALHLLKFPPTDAAGDVWRRLMQAAEKNQDKALAKKAFDWIIASQRQFGFRPDSSAYIGDVLKRLGLESDAQKIWSVYVKHDRSSTDSRECAWRLMSEATDAEKIAFFEEMLSHSTPFHGRYATWLGDLYLADRRFADFAKVINETANRRRQRPFEPWDLDIRRVADWGRRIDRDEDISAQDRDKVLNAIRNMEYGSPSAAAALSLMEMETGENDGDMEHLLATQEATVMIDSNWNGWDGVFPYAQAALSRKHYLTAATIASGLLSNFEKTDEGRQKNARKIVTQSYARLGSVGLTIDDDSPIAPLLRAALYLRLGDEKLAFAAYEENRQLFDGKRDELPVDLIVFVCSQRVAAGGDANHDYVEDILRGWLVNNSESQQVDEESKAKIQLLLARNYFKARRFDVARSEFTTTINRYPGTQQAIEARFGIGESFMSQKVFDQAAVVFEELARSADMETVVRAEFLRGVLAFRRGDRDDARDIFRSVLERVPDVSLANQALFNLSEVYGSEERYIDQLNLLRTVGRLGRKSKRLHAPGLPLSIVVHDSDLGISRGHNKIPVIVTTKPSGDREEVMLTSTGAGRGLFRADLDTRLGAAELGDKVLQLVGGDTIECDYPDEFKNEFKKVPLSDVEITIAATAEFEAASSKIVDEEVESFSERLAREEAEEEGEVDQRVSQIRPANQIKPGNAIYMRVLDADRDLSNERDEVPVKLLADSGDSLQVMLQETEPHSGVFEGMAKTDELPAGALASDTAIGHSPLMAIDLDPKSAWLAEPDGATPKSLSIDMKDLKRVSRVRMTSPDAENNAPVRVSLLGSNDGEYWFRLASHPEIEQAADACESFASMQQRVYIGRYSNFTTWYQVSDLGKNREPSETSEVESLSWRSEDEEENTRNRNQYGILWTGKLIQQRDGAARINVRGTTTALALNGKLELPIARGEQSVDLWLSRGAHDLTIFATTDNGSKGVEATIARADYSSERVQTVPFRATDFDLDDPAAKIVGNSLETNEQVIVELPLADAKLNKKSDNFGSRLNQKPAMLNYWSDKADQASWEFNIDEPGVYEVWMKLAHDGEGSEFDVEIAGEKIACSVPDTGSWTRYRDSKVATLSIDQAGQQSLKILPTAIENNGLMDLQSVQLRRAASSAIIQRGATWDFRFSPTELRYTRLVFHEFLGESVAISNVEIGGESQEEQYIPTDKDVLSLATNDTLEIAAGDTVTATYTDEFTQNSAGGSQLLTKRLSATYNNADVEPITYEFARAGNGQVSESRLKLKRVEAGDRIIVEITDYDEDRSSKRDTIDFEIRVNDEQPLKLTATETEEYSGVFTKEVDTAASTEAEKLVIDQGDRIFIKYMDTQNTFPGHAVPRESVVYVNRPTDAQITILESRTVPSEVAARTGAVSITPPESVELPSRIALGAPITVEVIDPDRAKNSGSTVKIGLLTTDGSSVIVECKISSAFQENRAKDDDALERGRFIGQVIPQLGGGRSPQLVPKSPRMPGGLIGRVLPVDSKEEEITSNLIARVINLTGADTLSAAYMDKQRVSGEAKRLMSEAKLVADGVLTITDREYKEPIEKLHVGEKIYFAINDPDQDVTDEQDTVSIQVTTALGENETVPLTETLAHSGYFTGSFRLRANVAPETGNFNEKDPAIECYFGDIITATYSDLAAASSAETLEVKQTVPVVIGTNGLVSAFTKTFNDETLAVETKFRIAESYFELFKSHKELERSEEQQTDLEAGRRVLREVMEDYPDPKYAPRIAYLLGQFAQELEQWDEAIRSYELIIRRYPDHTLAADARYKLAQSYEEAGDFDEALEAYVTLAATHPKSPLIASVMIRISDYFYKKEDFEIAAQVGQKFGERFEGHEHAAEMAFRVGQCFYKTEDYKSAGAAFDDFAKNFPDDELGADSLFWSGEAYRLSNNNSEAFRRYNRCRWDYPESEAATYARGRLALPEMLQQFEAEANSVDIE
ncbi:MAG: tetratricopeptide repeat protein [Planctomycetota bacterium]